MIDVESVLRLHSETVERWHHQAISNTYQGWLWIVCNQHSYNFQLWHQEDIARSPTATDAELADVKRRIDRLNQQRNDWIEKIDDAITEHLIKRQIQAQPNAPRNTETPGSAIDRLSILALRIYHLDEQLERRDVDAAHHNRVRQRLSVCRRQHQDLAESLGQLLDDIQSGRKRHSTYRQLKMYNDPTLNPHLYAAPALASAESIAVTQRHAG